MIFHQNWQALIEGRAYMNKGGAAGAAGGTIWFIGWLFTISYAQLIWWKIILGIVIWPYYLGEAVRLFPLLSG
jgi:hypothetical protein